MELWNKEQVKYVDNLWLSTKLNILVMNGQIMFVANVRNKQKLKTRKKNVIDVVIGIVAVEIVRYLI